jgi:hypothetical protein
VGPDCGEEFTAQSTGMPLTSSMSAEEEAEWFAENAATYGLASGAKSRRLLDRNCLFRGATMIGWSITVFRQTANTMSPAVAESPLGSQLAGWSAARLDWINELVFAQKAIDLGGNGYPQLYTVMAEHLLSETVGRNNCAEAAQCPPSEWLIVVAWDQS